MMLLSTKLQKVKKALTSIDGVRVSHYRRPPNLSGWIIWAEESDDGSLLCADNKLYEQIVTGKIEYWTKEEFDPVADAIQEALNADPAIGWRLSYVEYDESSELIYHEWTFTVI